MTVPDEAVEAAHSIYFERTSDGASWPACACGSVQLMSDQRSAEAWIAAHLRMDSKSMTPPSEAIDAASEAFLRESFKRKGALGATSLALLAAIEAATPFIALDSARSIRSGMEAWAGDKELGFLDGYIEAGEA